MPINNKPFSWAEGLRRVKFLGRPNFFNTKDVNKELAIIHSFMEEFNKIFAVASTVQFSVPSFNETLVGSTWTRQISLSWSAGEILYKGVKFSIPTGGIPSFSMSYTAPNTNVSPKDVKPPTYIVLCADLVNVDYSMNPTLCGLQGTEFPNSVPSVDVEQYQNVEIKLVDNPSSFSNVVCILATIHPKFTIDGIADGFGFMYATFNNGQVSIKNGKGNKDSVLATNGSLFEYITERVFGWTNKLLNERQLVRRFDLADLSDPAKARHNLGLSNLVNRRQLVQDENLRDLTSPLLARHYLGLGNSATRNIGTTANDVARGDLLPTGAIVIWSGSPSTIPPGWALCNGASGTPNLEGRFVVGFKSSDTEFNVIGKFDGAKEKTLSVSELPEHNHEMQIAGKHRHTMFNIQGGIGAGGAQDGDNPEDYGGTNCELEIDCGGASGPAKNTIGRSGEHKHVIDKTGGGKAFSILPPYYVMCYIMYTGATIAPPTPPTLPPALTYPNFSTPTTGTGGTDNGYSTYTAEPIGGGSGITVGSGITLTNPE